MTDKIKSITLVTENCEVLTFDIKHVFWFELDQRRNFKFENTEMVFDDDNRELFGIALYPTAEIIAQESFASSYDWKERLKGVDVTAFEINYEDGSVKTIGILWPDGEENRYLTSHPGQRLEETPAGNFIFTSASDVPGTEQIYDLDAIDKIA